MKEHYQRGGLGDVKTKRYLLEILERELGPIRERRVEFAWENLRYFDLLRWHQFENAFGHNMYGFTRTANRAKEYFAAGNWFWPETPTFDKDGFPSFEAMADGTYIVQHGERKYDEKIYLWPLPSDDVLIMNGKLVQNPGY